MADAASNPAPRPDAPTDDSYQSQSKMTSKPVSIVKVTWSVAVVTCDVLKIVAGGDVNRVILCDAKRP